MNNKHNNIAETGSIHTQEMCKAYYLSNCTKPEMSIFSSFYSSAFHCYLPRLGILKVMHQTCWHLLQSYSSSEI